MKGLGDIAVAHFNFKTIYDPEIGNITIGGRVRYHEKKLKDALIEKKDGIFLKEKPFEEVNNVIVKSSMIQAMLLAREMGMPSPIQLPSVSLKIPKKGDAGKSYA